MAKHAASAPPLLAHLLPVLLIAGAAVGCRPLPPVVEAVARIDITYSATSVGSTQEHFVVQQQGGGFVVEEWTRDGTAERLIGPPVSLPVERVQALDDALAAPSSDHAAVARLLLQRMDTEALRDSGLHAEPPAGCSAQAWTMAVDEQMAPEALQQIALARTADTLWMHDNQVAIVVQVQRRGVGMETWSTQSQQAFVRPWTKGPPLALPGMDMPTTQTPYWSVALTDALQGVVPEQSDLHARLGLWMTPLWMQVDVVERAGARCLEAAGEERTVGIAVARRVGR